ncbi:hypothetical protein ABXV27_27750, partial [Klebsiella pneumoniae]|uniref:hypothetical protein n=1 Tax=Klebsiella pneumoniae TaxID=573 RepID=UPI00339CDC75
VGHLFMFLVGGKTPDQSVHLNLTTTKWSKLNAQPVTERVLSAIRVAAMGKERYWIKRPASALAYR